MSGRYVKLEYDICSCGKKKIFSANMCKSCYADKKSKESMEGTICACGRKKHRTSLECHVCRKNKILNVNSATHKFDTCSCGKVKRADVSKCRECHFEEKRNAVRFCSRCGIVLTEENCYPSSWRNGERKCKVCRKKDANERYDGIKAHIRDESQKLKLKVMESYGGKCACCGESNIAFLSIDHILGDGAAHRSKMPGVNLYKWLRNNGFPKDNFQCLCMNCNFAKSNNPGGCPHEIERQKQREQNA